MNEGEGTNSGIFLPPLAQLILKLKPLFEQITLFFSRHFPFQRAVEVRQIWRKTIPSSRVSPPPESRRAAPLPTPPPPPPPPLTPNSPATTKTTTIHPHLPRRFVVNKLPSFIIESSSQSTCQCWFQALIVVALVVVY